MTSGVVKGRIAIVVGAKNSRSLNLPQVYSGFSVHVHENSVSLLAAKKLAHVHCKKLKPGCDIGVSHKDDSVGTLGGFVKVGDDVYGMTSHHVIQNNTQFQQPSAETIFKIRELDDTAELDQNLRAGESGSEGIDTIENHSWLDYQLLKIDGPRKPSPPRLNQVDEVVAIMPPDADLNNIDHTFNFVDKEAKFSKVGAETGQTVGRLVQACRSDSYVVVEGRETHTLEFAFKAKRGKFASHGDSGAWVFTYEKGKPKTLIGVVVAATDSSPHLTYVTPISSIVENYRSRTGKQIVFVE